MLPFREEYYLEYYQYRKQFFHAAAINHLYIPVLGVITEILHLIQLSSIGIYVVNIEIIISAATSECS